MNRLAALTILLTLLYVSAASQSVDVVKVFDEFRKNHLQEKIYVHTDRTFYLCGELIWFKAYAVDGAYHRPLAISSVAYVEILDNSNTPVLQTKIRMEDGKGHGSLSIPLSLNSGNYHFRAYTRWMKNDGANFFFTKQITIVNTFKPLTPATAKDQEPDIQFFPEGGNMVNGIESRIAFKGQLASGNSFEFSGVVVSSRGDTAATFQSARFGMGSFSLTPDAGVTYTAIVEYKPGVTAVYTLPNAYEKGVVMKVSSGDQHTVQIVAAGVEEQTYTLFVQSRHRIIQTEKILLSGGTASIPLNKSLLADGINHLTLFDANHNPVCERLLFKRPGSEIRADISGITGPLQSRRQVSLDLTLTEQAVSDLSVSVFLLDSLNRIDPMTIQNYLLLSSDLVGKVEQPGFYFGNDPDAERCADHLMLTQGWRRFNWNYVFDTSRYNRIYEPEYRGQIIEAKALSKTGGSAGGISTFLAVQGAVANITSTISDQNGNLKFEMGNYFGNRPLYLVPTDGNDSSYTFELLSPFSNENSSIPHNPFELSSSIAEFLERRSLHMQTRKAYYEDKLEFRESDKQFPFYRYPSRTYRLDDYIRFSIMEDVMREYVQEVWVRKREDGLYYKIYNEHNSILYNTDPLVLFDGIPVFDVDRIMKVDPLNVERMEIVSRKYFIGKVTRDGIVSYITYTGELDGLQLTKNETLKNYGGLQLEREFYQPKYDSQRAAFDRLPDHRNLMYWNPNVVTDQSGKTRVSFFTSDLSGRYAIVVEGLTRDGKPVTGSALLTVDGRAE